MDELNDKFRKSAEKFTMVPSPEVWANVESSIQKNKNKKRIILFFLVASIVSGGLIYKFTPEKQLSGISSINSGTTINTKSSGNEVQTNIQKSRSDKQNVFMISQNDNLKSFKNKIIEQRINVNHINDNAPYNLQKNVSDNNNPSFSNSNQKEFNEDENGEIWNNVSSNYCNDDIQISHYQLNSKSPTSSASAELIPPIKTDSVIPLPKESKWNITVAITPSWNSSNQIRNDKKLFTMDYALNAGYHFSNGWELTAGIGISNILHKVVESTYEVKKDSVLVANIWSLGNNENGRDYSSVKNIKNKFTYAVLSIGIKKSLYKSQKFSLTLDPSLEINKNVGFSGYAFDFENGSYTQIKSKAIRSVVISADAGISCQYNINNNILIGLSPSYKSFLKSAFNDSYPINEKFNQMELKFLIGYVF